MELSKAYLESIFNYKDGHLYWKYAKSNSVKAGAIAGGIKSDGYYGVMINNKTYFIHRIIWAMHYGSMPESELDHINRDKSDNRIENLRLSNRVMNIHNMGKKTNNTSGHKGVIFDKASGKYVARIGFNNKRKFLGRFDTANEAGEAYQQEYKTLINF